MRQVLVVGGSYFLGRVFVDTLRAVPGVAITVVNRGRRPLGLDGVQEIACDRHDAAGLRHRLPALAWDAVVDFCAYAPDDLSVLLEALPGTTGRYVFVSSAAVHQVTPHLPITEDAPAVERPAPGPGGDYGFLKWRAEQRLAALCRARDILPVVLRPVIVYGQHNYAPRESLLFERLEASEPLVVPAPPQALFSMVSVWDVAQVCLAAITRPELAGGTYLVCADELVSYDSLLVVLESVVGRPIAVDRKPARVIATRQLPMPFPIGEHLVYSGARLREAIAHRFLSLREGMERTWAWYRHTRPGATR